MRAEPPAYARPLLTIQAVPGERLPACSRAVVGTEGQPLEGLSRPRGFYRVVLRGEAGSLSRATQSLRAYHVHTTFRGSRQTLCKLTLNLPKYGSLPLESESSSTSDVKFITEVISSCGETPEHLPESPWTSHRLIAQRTVRGTL